MPDRRPWIKIPAIETEAVLAVGSLTLFAASLVAVMVRLIPPENEKYAMLLLGALIGIVKDTFARYFNVTKGGAEQRQTIADLATAASATATLAASPLSTTTETRTTAKAGDGAADPEFVAWLAARPAPADGLAQPSIADLIAEFSAQKPKP